MFVHWKPQYRVELAAAMVLFQVTKVKKWYRAHMEEQEKYVSACMHMYMQAHYIAVHVHVALKRTYRMVYTTWPVYCTDMKNVITFT